MDKESRFRKITACKLCHKQKSKLSRRGFCIECSRKLNQDAISQLRVKKGEIFEKWAKNLLNAMHAQP